MSNPYATDIRELNASMLDMLQQLAHSDSNVAEALFGVTRTETERIGNMSRREVQALVSSSLLLFQPRVIVSDLLGETVPEESPSALSDLNVRFLILLQRIAFADPGEAEVRFGVTRPEAEAVRNTTLHKLQLLAASRMLIYQPRAILSDLLETDATDIAKTGAILRSISPC